MPCVTEGFIVLFYWRKDVQRVRKSGREISRISEISDSRTREIELREESLVASEDQRVS
jgi:hypothetical protein